MRRIMRKTLHVYTSVLHLWSVLSNLYQGHSCKIGNEPVLAWKKMKTMFGVFSIYICFLFEVLSMKKAITNLKIVSGTFSPPNFMVPVSQDDEGILEVILFPE